MVSGLVVPRTGEVIAGSVRWARTPVERARGLLGGDPPAPGEALILVRARRVHTFGLSYPIDVCFCDRGWQVLHVVAPLRPRRVTRWVLRSSFVVEMRAGAMQSLAPGDQLSLAERSER